MKILRALLFACPTLAFAQRDSIKILPHIEISSIRLNRFTVGQNHIDFDSTTLRLSQQSNLADFLQFNTPLSIKSYGTGLSTVSSRGTSSSHTAIIWNGFSIQNSLNGLVDLPLNDAGAFEHIGVKFGGGSAIYGSGAIGGSIYLDNDISQKHGFHSELGLTSGSYGLLGQNFKVSTGNNKVAASFRISHQASRNQFIYRNTAEIGQPLKYINNSAFEKFNLTGSLFFTINKNNFLKINAWESQNFRQVAPTMTASNDSAQLEDAHSRLSAEWSFFKGKTVSKARVAHFDEDNLYRSTVVDSSRNRVKTTIAELEHNIDWKHSSLRIGTNWTQNTAITNNFEAQYVRQRMALFGSYNFTAFTTDFSLAVRQELVDSKLAPFTCSLGFLKKLYSKIPMDLSNLQSALVLRGSASRNYNLPALNDLYWTSQGNPNLKAENGLSGEMGIDWTFKKDNRSSKISLTGFATRTYDLIQWIPNNDGIWRPSNINEVFTRGLESFYKLDFTKKALKGSFRLSYQLARSTDKSGKQLLYTPEHTSNASILLSYKRLYWQYTQSASSRRYATTDNTTWTKAFTLGNTTIGSTFKIEKLLFDVNFKINNLFDTDYQVIAYYPNPKRFMYINLNVKL